MSPVRQYRYGTNPRVLVVRAVLLMSGGLLMFIIGVFGDAQLFWFVNQLPDWFAKAFFFCVAVTLVGVSFGNIYLLLRRFLSPQYVETSDTNLSIPVSVWSAKKKVIPFGAIKKVIGPRSGRLEIRTSHSTFLDRSYFESESEFVECCQWILDKVGISRSIRVASGERPKYRRIADKFTTGHLSGEY